MAQRLRQPSRRETTITDRPIHRLHLHFQELPVSLRVLYTATLIVLGMGYFFATIYVFASHAGRDGDPSSLSIQDLVIAYSGSKEDTRLEGALKGPMRGMLPSDETSRIIAWVHKGANQREYKKDIRPILNKRCIVCHNGSNPHLPNLDGYEKLIKMVEFDRGADLFTLVRVSHIHLFGMTFIFFIISLIFSHAYVRPVWFKCVVVAAPFVAIVMDVSSWYFTKLFNPFAWVVMLSGVLMALCFAYMWVISVYQMWFSAMPTQIAERHVGARRVID
ncbi:MAG: hypothetical protein ACE5LB_16640 [Acidiferrobacterales bacterium]